jgi:hypothetical protein
LVIEFVASPVENWVSAEKSKMVIYSKTAAQFADQLGIQVGSGQLISYVTANEFIGMTAVTANDPPILKYSELPARKYLVYEGRTFYSDEKGNTFPQATGITGVLPDGTKTFGGFIESDIAGVNNVASSLNDQVKLVNSNLPNITSNEFLGQYMFTPTETTQYYIGKGFEIVQPEPTPIIISNEAQIILNKFDNGDYIVSEGINSGIELLRDGSVTSEVFVSSFNNLLKNKSIIDRTIEVIPPVIQPIQLSQDNFLPNGNVRIIRMTGIEANDYELTDGVALENLQSFLDSTVFRLLTQAELDFIPPEPIPEPTPEPIKTYTVNTYRLNEFGGVYNEIVYNVDGNQLQDLESKYLTSLSGSPTPSDQEVFDFYNYVDTTTDETMVSQSIGPFSLENGQVKGSILYIAENSFNSYYYNKTLYSIIQIKDQSDLILKRKLNNLNFTENQRDETINISEGVGNEISAVKIEFYVSKNSDGTLPLSLVKVEEEVAKEVNLPPCPIGQHRDFNGKCVNDGGKDIGGSTSLLGKVMGITALLGTLALLGSKRR